MVNAIILLKVRADRINEVAQALVELDGVSEVYSVAGQYDLVVIIRGHNDDQIAAVVTEQILMEEGLISSETLIAFRTYSKHDLERMFKSAGFEIEQAWSDIQPFTFDTVDETLEWMLKAGPAAGLDASIREDRRDEVLKRFVEELGKGIAQDGSVTFTHRFAAVVGRHGTD